MFTHGETLFDVPRSNVDLDPGARLLAGFVLAEADALISLVHHVRAASPFRHMATRGGGRMSVGLTNCGDVGWVSDERGYRYAELDPETGRPWPPMPDRFLALARRAASAVGHEGFEPDACLVNRYTPGTRIGMHQDHDEHDLGEPIVSVSLGLPAVFLWGGATRDVRPRRVRVEHGDVVVFGGPARRTFHGVAAVAEGVHPATGAVRYNLTFRRAR